MPKSTNLDNYLKHLQEATGHLGDQVDSFLLSFVTSSKEQRADAAKKARDLLGVLKNTLASSTYPDWIYPLEQNLNVFAVLNVGNPESARDSVKQIVLLQDKIRRQRWQDIAESEIDEIDFEDIYRKSLDELGIPELFNELVRELEEILKSDAIDSITAYKEIERLLAIIKRNANRDVFSTLQTTVFAVSFAKNFGFELLEIIPGVGTAVKAYRKTCDQLEVKTSQLQAQMKHQISEKFLPQMKLQPIQVRQPARLEHRPDEPPMAENESSPGAQSQ